MLDQVEERLLAPVDVVEDDDAAAARAAACSNVLRNGPGDLLRRGRRLGLAEQRADRGRRSLVGRQHTELLQHLDDRPVGDPLAVRQAAATDDRASIDDEELGDEARLADAGVGDDRHQLAAALGLYRSQTLPEQRELALTADEARLVAPLRRLPHAQEPVGGDRLRLALQPSGSTVLDLDRVADKRSVGAPSSTSPGAAACSSRAATLTASPVASRSSVPVTTSPV